MIIGYKKVDEQTSKNRKVFYEKKAVCNNGRARYQLALTQQKNFSVTGEFAASVCNLPQTYNKMAYFRFIEKWGTVGGLIRFFTLNKKFQCKRA